MKTEQDIDTKTIPKEEEYITQEIDKLSKDAEILFPNWELFGLINSPGCAQNVVDSITNERLLLEGTFFDIVCHISENNICHNYIRLKRGHDNIAKMKNIFHNNLPYLKKIVDKKGKFKIQEDDGYKITKWIYDHVKNITTLKNKNLSLALSVPADPYDRDGWEKQLLNKNRAITQLLSEECETKNTKVPDIIFGGTENIQKLYQKNLDIKKCNKKCFFHTTGNNRSIGVFVIFDEKNKNKKYAIICNYTDKDDINEVKKGLRKKYTIINLPRVQSDNHSCSVLNKIFLTEMHKFFVEKKHDINELLSCKDKEDNNGDIALTDEVKTLFPNLYKYQQYDVEKSENIPDEFKSYLIGTDKYNVLTNHDLNVLKPKEKQKNLNENERKKEKIFNVGLLREGWGMAIDFISQNIDNVPLCELEIFMEIFEKQCNFFDRVISLQAQNSISTNNDYFANRKNAIQKIKQEIENRQNNRKNNGEEKICDFIFDINLSFLVLMNGTTAISPKLCQYIDRYNNYFCKRVVEESRNMPASNYNMNDIYKMSHLTFPIDYGADKDESVVKIVPRKPAFEGNEAIRNGLRNEYQEKYNTHDNTINKEDHKSKANHNYNICECNNLCSCFGSSSGQQKVDVGNINMNSL